MLPYGLEVLSAVVIGTLAASVLFVWWSWQNSRQRLLVRDLLADAEGSVVFLFDDEVLLDASPDAQIMFRHAPGMGSDWDRLTALLAPRFPDLKAACGDLASEGRIVLSSAEDHGGRVEAEYWNGVARISVHGASTDERNGVMLDVIERELSLFRDIADRAPQLIWRRDDMGRMTWANGAYLDLSDAAYPPPPNGAPPWPPHEIFEAFAPPQGDAPVVHQQWLLSEGRLPPQCFEITSLRHDDGTLHFATDVTAIADSRDARSKFVQTLTKTFAQLSVGLAVFDRDRRLVLFNPALVDLMDLPPEFLIGHPTLGAFLDRLREAQMIPEPRDYISWRQEIEALEAAAEDGSYEDVWDLTNGLTYRVTGRPHPDGAIAFLFEDISEELSLTRRFRSQIDHSQTILDEIAEGVASFSATGEMLMSNRAYRDLWSSEGHMGFGGATLSGELGLWESASAPSHVWHRFLEPGQPGSWIEDVVQSDGRRLTISCRTTRGGERIVRFSDPLHRTPAQSVNPKPGPVSMGTGG